MDTVSQLKTMMTEQTELICSLRTVIDKKTSHAELFKGLTVHKQVIPLAEEEKICPVCDTPMERIEEEYVHRELVFTPARCEIYEYYTESYGCPNCKEGKGDTEKAVIIKSLYRQEKDCKEYGSVISRTALANWIIYSAEHYFRPLYDYFHRQLLQRKFLIAAAPPGTGPEGAQVQCREPVFHVVVPHRGRWSACHPSVRIHSDKKRKQCGRLPRWLSGVSGNGWPPGLQ